MTTTEEELIKANRALKTLSACNRALVYAVDERSLLIEICDVLVKNGGYRFAWVGYAMQDESRTVRPVAYAGYEDGYLDVIKVTWDDAKTGRGPFGTAIRLGTASIVGETGTDQNFAPWREAASKRGYASVIALPLTAKGETFGCLGIYGSEPDMFDAKEVQLLQELVSNLAYGISALRVREEHKRGEEEKSALENQLRHSQKMEAVGTLAGGIAHDFNNILTTITAYCALIERKTPENSPVRPYLGKLLGSTDRASALTQGLLAYSRKQPLNPQPVEVNALIAKASHLLGRLLGEDIELAILPADQPLTVLADSLQIEQVLMNLATNARDAMPCGGLLRIAAERLEIERKFVKVHGYGVPGSYALITVSDTGCGMCERTRERIFEPFFTTKEVDKGTGLGLSIAYGIVKQHDGYINVYSEPGKGTTFNVCLPLTGCGEENRVAADLVHTRCGDETVLLVEDDPEIRATLQEIMEDEGYTVIVAVDGEDGLRKFREHEEVVQLLILDVVMPKKNGNAIYDEIRIEHPHMKVLFLSGYTADLLQTKGVLRENVDFLAKPLMVDKFLLKIREVLER